MELYGRDITKGYATEPIEKGLKGVGAGVIAGAPNPLDIGVGAALSAPSPVGVAMTFNEMLGQSASLKRASEYLGLLDDDQQERTIGLAGMIRDDPEMEGIELDDFTPQEIEIARKLSDELEPVSLLKYLKQEYSKGKAPDLSKDRALDDPLGYSQDITSLVDKKSLPGGFPNVGLPEGVNLRDFVARSGEARTGPGREAQYGQIGGKEGAAAEQDGDTVLCTALYNMGLLDPEIYESDSEYAREYIDSDTYIGYTIWARHLAKIPWIVKLMAPWIKRWAQQMAYNMDQECGLRNKVGEITEKYGIPICRLIGKLQRIMKWVMVQ
jgi:hypothetical protein